jgi:nitrate/nitrite transporter NarK
MPYASTRSAHLAARIGTRATVLVGLLTLTAAIALLSFATAATPYPLYGLLLALVGGGMGLAMPPLSGMIVHALPPSHAGVSSGLNSTTRELGSALGVAVLSTVLTVRFASHLPTALQNVPGARGQAIKHSITSALRYASSAPDPTVRAHLLLATRDAFTRACGRCETRRWAAIAVAIVDRDGTRGWTVVTMAWVPSLTVQLPCPQFMSVEM